MTNFEDLSETIDNFVREMRTIIGLDRLGKTETTDNIVIDKIGCIYRSSSFARANFWPSRKRFDCNTNILKTELVNRKRTSEINSPMSEDVENYNCIIWKLKNWARLSMTLTGIALHNMSTNKLFHERKPETRG